MALPQIEDVRNLSAEQLNEQVLEVKKQLFDLRLQQATGQLEKTHQFKHLRHRLAQLLTVEGELKRQAAAEAASQAAPEAEAEVPTQSTPGVETTEAAPDPSEVAAEEATTEEE